MAVISIRNQLNNNTFLLQSESSGEIIFKRVPDNKRDEVKFIRTWADYDTFMREYEFYTRFKELYESESIKEESDGRRKIEIPD